MEKIKSNGNHFRRYLYAICIYMGHKYPDFELKMRTLQYQEMALKLLFILLH